MDNNFEELTFNFEDFNDYKKEIEEIKDIYNDLMNDKSVQKMLKKQTKKQANRELKTIYNNINENVKNYNREIICNKKIELKTSVKEKNLDTGYKLENGLC